LDTAHFDQAVTKARDRIRTIPSLKGTEHHYFQSFDRAPIGYVVLSPVGRIEESNRRAGELLAVSSADLTLQPFTHFIHEDDRTNYSLAFAHLQETGEPQALALRLWRGGAAFRARVVVNLSPDDKGAIVGRLVFDDLEGFPADPVPPDDLSAQQASTVDSLGVLAGGIAHDFNNLLGGILGYISLAETSLPDAEAASVYLKKAGAIFARAKALTSQLMTFSKGSVTHLDTGSLGPVLEAAVSSVLAGSSIDCNSSIAPDLSLCDFDGPQLEQVFTNLILNAKQAMTDNGALSVSASNRVLGKDEVASLPEGAYLCVSVTDNGEGIPRQALGKLFDPYFTTRKTGRGLGLAICRSIVQRHGGTIEVESEVGRGTTVRVFLPASLKAINVEQAVPTGSSPGGTILVMDDEASFREILGSMLRSLGYTVIEASCGEEMLKLTYPGHALKAAIFDLTNPQGMGGQQTLEAIREIHPKLPVIATSGFSEHPVLANPGKHGFAAGLAKPYHLAELASLLALHL
jgi:signal transduction histidine kinase